MPPEPVDVTVAEFKDAQQIHLLEIAAVEGVNFGADGDAVHGAVLIKDAAGVPLGLWLPVPPPAP